MNDTMKLKPYLYFALPMALMAPALGAATQEAAPTYTETNTSANSNIRHPDLCSGIFSISANKVSLN